MKQFSQHTYFNSYYYANIVSNIISREDASILGFISSFFDMEDAVIWLAKPFEKHGAFHKFIQHLILEFFEEEMNDYDQSVHERHIRDARPLDALYAEIAFENFNMGYDFDRPEDPKERVSYEMIEEYHDSLRMTGHLEELYEKITNEVFYVLFNNRKALMCFNLIASDYTSQVIKAEIEDDADKALFRKNGVLKRVAIPKWCQNAVYFRDRGRCCLCGRDLSNLFSTASVKHFDHIVPLALGGFNDVANIQLLCSTCNLAKSKREVATGDKYEYWY